MIKKITVIASLFLGVFTAEAAFSENGIERRCEQRGTILKYLASQYSEKPVAMGIAENGGVIEVLSSRDGDTFTIIVTTPDGRTCMLAAGEDWEPLARELKPHS